MHIYSFEMKGYVSFGNWAKPVGLTKKVTDQVLKHTLDDWMIKEGEPGENVYDIKNGELVLNEKRIKSTQVARIYEQSQHDYIETEDEVNLRELKEKYPEKYAHKKVDLETRKKLIDEFAEEEELGEIDDGFLSNFGFVANWFTVLLSILLFVNYFHIHDLHSLFYFFHHFLHL